ncbi:Cysteine-rich membrane protein 2 [Spironucleus salmonicida]|uniref:Cysteine-rich membrane protein 2 n=1 Tax=Spironucleus salmonicida TaxID=348837 RepID=V6LGM2_9EUKA|nr:Cysteine-rich membrane protein 2 [Spironucleus salmonicida]|eukprot:EST42851.1 Cysteine-rich membrane protein 2 [Spironucleus salmonicida]
MTDCKVIPNCTSCDSTTPALCATCGANHTLTADKTQCLCGTNASCKTKEMCITATSTCANISACRQNPFCTKCSKTNSVDCSSCAAGYGLDSTSKQCIKIACGVIPYCNKCTTADPTKCEACSAHMQINSTTNLCECTVNSGKGCQSDEICSPTRACVNVAACLHVQNCLRCNKTDPEKCQFCNNGMTVNADGQCEVAAKCGDNIYCAKCDSSNVCENCQINLKMALDGKTCECVLGSGKACPDGMQCARDTRICVKEAICLGAISNCETCWYHDQRLCDVCRAGYILSPDKSQCVAFTACMGIVGCSSCNMGVPALCAACDTELVGNGEACVANNKIGTGGIVGIVIAVVVVIGVIGGVVYFMKKKNSRRVPDDIQTKFN